MVNNEGALPLHIVCSYPERAGNIEIFKMFIKINPEAATKQKGARNEGDLPLHLAAKFAASAEDGQIAEASRAAAMLQLIISANPHGLHCKNSKGRFPLHCVMAAVSQSETRSSCDTKIRTKLVLARVPAALTDDR